MKIICNGTAREVDDGVTMTRLLEDMKLPVDTVVAEINGRIIDRDQYDHCILRPDDRVELIRFVGGG